MRLRVKRSQTGRRFPLSTRDLAVQPPGQLTHAVMHWSRAAVPLTRTEMLRNIIETSPV